MQNPMEERKKVLITGAAGRIGSSLRVLMKDRYKLRLMFHSKVLPVEEDEEGVIGDLCDFEKMSEACEGVDAVVHMAGLAGGGDFPGRLVPVNLVGTYNVFEAARQQGVHKVVFASTNHVTGMYEKEGVYTTPGMPVRPDSYYGVSKAAGEALARYYVDAFGMSIHCLRIGSFLGGGTPKGRGVRSLSTWISPRDMAQLVWRCIESDLPFGIFYGISDNTRKYWDITNARELIGYAPEDDAEEYADEVEGA